MRISSKMSCSLTLSFVLSLCLFHIGSSSVLRTPLLPSQSFTPSSSDGAHLSTTGEGRATFLPTSSSGPPLSNEHRARARARAFVSDVAGSSNVSPNTEDGASNTNGEREVITNHGEHENGDLHISNGQLSSTSSNEHRGVTYDVIEHPHEADCCRRFVKNCSAIRGHGAEFCELIKVPCGLLGTFMTCAGAIFLVANNNIARGRMKEAMGGHHHMASGHIHGIHGDVDDTLTSEDHDLTKTKLSKLSESGTESRSTKSGSFKEFNQWQGHNHNDLVMNYGPDKQVLIPVREGQKEGPYDAFSQKDSLLEKDPLLKTIEDKTIANNDFHSSLITTSPSHTPFLTHFHPKHHQKYAQHMYCTPEHADPRPTLVGNHAEEMVEYDTGYSSSCFFVDEYDKVKFSEDSGDDGKQESEDSNDRYTGGYVRVYMPAQTTWPPECMIVGTTKMAEDSNKADEDGHYHHGKWKSYYDRSHDDNREKIERAFLSRKDRAEEKAKERAEEKAKEKAKVAKATGTAMKDAMKKGATEVATKKSMDEKAPKNGVDYLRGFVKNIENPGLLAGESHCAVVVPEV